MGSKKKDRAKARKAGKASAAALKEAVANAQVVYDTISIDLKSIDRPTPVNQ